jgi:hypothetical protein
VNILDTIHNLEARVTAEERQVAVLTESLKAMQQMFTSSAFALEVRIGSFRKDDEARMDAAVEAEERSTRLRLVDPPS